jgi:hypothetical protein
MASHRVREWKRASGALNAGEWSIDFMGMLIDPPVGKWNPGADRTEKAHLAYYTFFRPMIIHFYGAVNTRNTALLKKIMRGIVLQIWVSAPQLLSGAANVGLIPPWPAGAVPAPDRAVAWEILSAYVDSWYAMLFDVPAANRLSLVIQGGEAVNMYSTYKTDNVPTHDTDTRFLIGDHFNYLTDIQNVSAGIRRFAHQCRFFTAMALTTMLSMHAALVMYVPAKLAEYRQKLNAWGGVPGVPGGPPNLGNALFHTPAGVPIDQAVKITPVVQGKRYLEEIASGTYDINDNDYLYKLMYVGLEIYIEGAPAPVREGIVDLFIPRKQLVLGHTDNIHQYFNSEQAKSAFMPGADRGVTTNGSIPYVMTDLTFGEIVQTATTPEVLAPWGGRIETSPYPAVLPPYNTSGIRVVPYGYLVYDSLRMLLVAAHDNIRNRPGKYEKYKQKLNVLLTVGCRADISRTVLNVAKDTKTRQPEFAKVLTGGAMEEEPVDVEPPTMTGGAAPERSLTEEEIAKAIEISDKFSESKEPVDIASIKGDEYIGYMDYLSYLDPGFSDYRLPRPVAKDDTSIKFGPAIAVEKTETPELATPAQSTGGVRLRTYR